MKILPLIILILTFSTFGQDYGPKAGDKEAAVKMHFAITLLRGDLNKQQEEFLLKAISNRRLANESEARKLFSTRDLRDIFFGIGTEDISTFRDIYNKESVTDKREAWRSLNEDDRIDVRRVNFAWGIGYLNLSEVQTDFLLRMSKRLPGITEAEIDLLEVQAVALFPKDIGRLLFSSIGPYVKSCPTANLQNICPCSVGSSFNVSCDGECTIGGSSCTRTGDGCGFAWLFACDGKCQAG